MNKNFQKTSFILFCFLFSLSVFSSDVIQTQESNQNELLVAELTKIKTKNNIVTIRLKIRNKSDKNEKVNFYFKNLYVIDEKNQKKYFILKDSENNCIGGPFSNDNGGRFEFWLKAGSVKNIWAKLPEPTGNPESISIVIPGFLPFEDINLPSK